ncbi:hypothetical protein COLO4_37602 [Corchorus olitorius]|uniref:Uncharacterized protein n=1 Tax=Corchorus olitorius TaxID=93759 RepID=A0A1R3G0S9_9ROSI|nr:hypothetical protein COLO4_37602 [Corchorus olitorius]
MSVFGVGFLGEECDECAEFVNPENGIRRNWCPRVGGMMSSPSGLIRHFSFPLLDLNCLACNRIPVDL